MAVQAGEVIYAAVMNTTQLARFVDAQLEDAKQQGVLFSLHLKATMMKVSDPIMFGVAVKRFYSDVLAKHPAVLEQVAFEPTSVTGAPLARLASLRRAHR